MLAFIDMTENKNTITVDGYTTNKSEKGIIRDAARALAKYHKEEAYSLMKVADEYDPEWNSPFLRASESEGGYFFEYEEVPCAARYDEEKDEVETRDGFHVYFVIRVIK